VKNFKYLSFISFIPEMRSPAKIDELILRILREKGPELSPKELYLELCRRLGPENGVSRVTLYRHMWSLETRKLVEKTRKGWRLNKCALFCKKRLNDINQLLERLTLFNYNFADVYVSPNVSYYTAAKLSQISAEEAAEIIKALYLGETIEFIREHMVNLQDGFLVSFEEKLLRNVGLIVWTGFRLSAEPVSAANLWELIVLVRKGELGEDALTRYFYYGLKKLFRHDAKILTFLKFLRDVGFFGALLMMLIGQDRGTLIRAKLIFSKIPSDEDEKEDEVDEDFFQSLLRWLMEREAVVIIPISQKFYASETEAEKMVEFEKWLAALREGRLDHRLWVFTKGKQLLETLIMWLKRLDPEALGAPIEFLGERYPALRELLDNQVDIDEIWTLRDLIAYYPAGKKIEFYQEILREIEKRLEANPELRRKLESLTAGNVDSPHDF